MAVATAIPTGTYNVDKVHSTVGFAVKHMVISTFRGRFEDYDASLVVGEDGTPQLTGTVKVDSLKVKDENLAAHLLSPDFFDTDQYPELKFESVSFDSEGDELVVEGDLTVRGATERVTARGIIEGPHEGLAGTVVGIELETTIDRTKFGLNWNADLPKGGKALANDVKLTVNLELLKA